MHQKGLPAARYIILAGVACALGLTTACTKGDASVTHTASIRPALQVDMITKHVGRYFRREFPQGRPPVLEVVGDDYIVRCNGRLLQRWQVAGVFRYCPSEHAVVVNPASVIAEVDTYAPVLVYDIAFGLYLAHEYGHAYAPQAANRDAAELLADCSAGSWLASYDSDWAPVLDAFRPLLEASESGNYPASSARYSAFRLGARMGIDECRHTDWADATTTALVEHS